MDYTKSQVNGYVVRIYRRVGEELIPVTQHTFETILEAVLFRCTQMERGDICQLGYFNKQDYFVPLEDVVDTSR